MSNVHPIPQSSTSTDALPIAWIEALFDKMALSYGKRFTDQWGGVEPTKLKDHWAKELACMSRKELSRGYAALERRDWPPTLPEFKKMCRPGIDVDAALTEAIEQLQRRNQGKDNWSHPAIYWAAQKVGYYEMTTMTHAQLKPRFAVALEDVMTKGDIKPVPAPQLMLTAPDEKPVTKETLAKFREVIKTFKGAAERVDHRAWAKRIVARAGEGDPSVTPLQLRMAKEALAEPETVE